MKWHRGMTTTATVVSGGNIGDTNNHRHRGKRQYMGHERVLRRKSCARVRINPNKQSMKTITQTPRKNDR